MAKQSICDDVDELGKWHGYEVFEPTIADDKFLFTGVQQYIIAKDDLSRWSNDEHESWAIMHKFSSYEE